MKKSFNSVTDTRTDCLDQTRRLYRSVTDIAQRLDDQLVRCSSVTDIFAPLAETLRTKLRDYCERLIFKDPVVHVRKTEELLWRKGFYDAVAAAKKLRKSNCWDDFEKALVSAHLAVAVGFYHHLILRLQLECDLELMGIIDFAYPRYKEGFHNGKNKIVRNKMHTEDVRRCATRLVHRSLICLGDVARYRLDLDPCWNPQIATRYYKMAILINPSIGMPYNQLGTMSGTRNYGLDAVYYYSRCILCPEPFEGADGNLKRAITTQLSNNNEENPVHCCVIQLLSLLRIWNSDAEVSDQTNQACQAFLINIKHCLSIEKSSRTDEAEVENADSVEAYLEHFRDKPPSHLTDEMVFMIIVICFATIVKLQSRESSNVHGVIALTLAIFSQLLQIAIEHMQELIIDTSVPNSDGYATNETRLIDLVDNLKNDNLEKNDSTFHNERNLLCQNDDFRDVNNKQNHFDEDENKVADINNSTNGISKSKIKTKSLLTKLRRLRRRRDSSDSDASERDDHTLGSSSDELNSNISETEEDVPSEDIALSDDALSDDLSDCEGVRLPSEQQSIVPDGEPQLEKSEKKCLIDEDHLKNNSNVNERQNGIDQTATKNVDKDSTTNSNSTTTLTTNSSETRNDSIASLETMIYLTQLQKQKLSTAQVLDITLREGLLCSIKICCDWLTNNPEIIKSCAQSSRVLLKRISTFLNLISVDSRNLLTDANIAAIFQNLNDHDLNKCVDVVPLPEDIDLRGLKILEDTQKNLDWEFLKKFKMNRKEETLLRTLKLLKFGHFLCSIRDCGVTCENDTGLFSMVESVKPENIKRDLGKESKDTGTEHPRGKLMRHMGKLWLKAEVRALESQLRSRLVSPYLVPDHEALAKYTSTLKRLVYAKKFVVVIPSVVVSALDEVKRTSGQAREATRWLEAQLRRGSRFLRAQRPHERLALPLVKGPKPKNKEAWVYFQIIECCHYLTNQTKVNPTSETEAPVVTLLTGCSAEDQKTANFSPIGITQSAGRYQSRAHRIVPYEMESIQQKSWLRRIETVIEEEFMPASRDGVTVIDSPADEICVVEQNLGRIHEGWKPVMRNNRYP